MAEQGYIELKVILVCGGDIFHSHVNITFAAASLLMTNGDHALTIAKY